MDANIPLTDRSGRTLNREGKNTICYVQCTQESQDYETFKQN